MLALVMGQMVRVPAKAQPLRSGKFIDITSIEQAQWLERHKWLTDV